MIYTLYSRFGALTAAQGTRSAINFSLLYLFKSFSGNVNQLSLEMSACCTRRFLARMAAS